MIVGVFKKERAQVGAFSVIVKLREGSLTARPGTPHSWEAMDPVAASYTPDITPLTLAAHKNNYEILKILIGTST